jgi:hypothetical protein
VTYYDALIGWWIACEMGAIEDGSFAYNEGDEIDEIEEATT